MPGDARRCPQRVPPHPLGWRLERCFRRPGAAGCQATTQQDSGPGGGVRSSGTLKGKGKRGREKQAWLSAALSQGAIWSHSHPRALLPEALPLPLSIPSVQMPFPRKKGSLSQRTREGTAAQAPVGLFIAVEQQLPYERRQPEPAGDPAVTWMPNAAQAFVGIGGTARRPCCPHFPHLGHTLTPPTP